jgi:hypothetical protein
MLQVLFTNLFDPSVLGLLVLVIALAIVARLERVAIASRIADEAGIIIRDILNID